MSRAKTMPLGPWWRETQDPPSPGSTWVPSRELTYYIYPIERYLGRWWTPKFHRWDMWSFPGIFEQTFPKFFFWGLIKMMKQHLHTYEFTVNKYASLIFQNFVLVALQPACLVVCLDLSSARTLFHRLIMTCYVLQDDVTPNVALCFQYFQLWDAIPVCTAADC